MSSAVKDLGQWREETDAHLAKLDDVTDKLQARSGADLAMLNAIRATQSEHGQQLTVIEGKIDKLDHGQQKLGRDVESLQADMGMVKGRLGKVEGKLDKMDSRLDKMDSRFATIDEKLDLLLNR